MGPFRCHPSGLVYPFLQRAVRCASPQTGPGPPPQSATNRVWGSGTARHRGRPTAAVTRRGRGDIDEPRYVSYGSPKPATERGQLYLGPRCMVQRSLEEWRRRTAARRCVVVVRPDLDGGEPLRRGAQSALGDRLSCCEGAEQLGARLASELAARDRARVVRFVGGARVCAL